MTAKTVTAFIVDRANYARLLPVLRGLRDDSRFDLRLILGGTFIVPRYGFPDKMLEADGFGGVPTCRTWHAVEGDNNTARGVSVGAGCLQYSHILSQHPSDYVIVIGDRYEAMAAALAVTYTGQCLVHFQGGEVSGTVDETTRHCLTKLAHYHVPSTQQAAETIVHRLSEPKGSILTVGCPMSDMAVKIVSQRATEKRPYMLIMYHPDGDHPGRQMDRVLSGAYRIITKYEGLRIKIWWPNHDPRSEQISRKILYHRRKHRFELLRNVHPQRMLRYLADAHLCVGNSSAFVRDAGYFGTPVVIVGDRQRGRQLPINARTVSCDVKQIFEAGYEQLKTGGYDVDYLYGEGLVTDRFLEALSGAPIRTNKHLTLGPRDDATLPKYPPLP